jgi:hypothetical protein
MRMVIVAAVLALLATPVAAQPATADAEAKLAEDAAAKGDFVSAANHYKLAHAADARPDLICNAGVAYYKAKDVTRAHLYLSRCQERGTALDAGFVQAVRTALTAVETTLRTGAFTPVDIVVRPESATVVIHALGESDAFVGSRLVWLPRGKHTLAVRLEGYAPQVVELDAQGSERQPVQVTLIKPVVTTPTPSEPTKQVPIEAEAPLARPSKVPAIVAIGGTALAFVVAGIAYAKAHDSADMAREAVTRDQYDRDKSTTKTWNGVMGASGILGAGGIAVSALLVLRW